MDSAESRFPVFRSRAIPAFVHKGAQLEEAVRSIESTILEGTALGERTLEIVSNKIVVIAGVRHEIDLWVQIKNDHAYDALFLFECKDWAEPIGKNEIIAFSEKIRATAATRGFFVAKQYSEYARAQAKLDSRLVLLDAATHHISPKAFRCVAWGNIRLTLKTVEAETPVSGVTMKKLVCHQNREVPLAAVVQSFTDLIVQERLRQPDTHDLADGEHELDALQRINLPPGTLVVDQVNIRGLIVAAKFNYAVKTPAFRYGYDVATRGRFWKFERFEIAPGQWIDGLSITGWGQPH